MATDEMPRRLTNLSLRWLAAMTLAAWVGAYQHDVWFELIDQAHHHHHHSSHEQGHHGHHHPGDTGHSDRDSIPVCDTHSELFVLSKTRSGTEAVPSCPDAASKTAPIANFTATLIAPAAPKHPPPKALLDLKTPELIQLAHIVESNAPPAGA
ncbi:MAG: hypothetical protein AAF236_07080 [Verrucomicrobiota bacterium]